MSATNHTTNLGLPEYIGSDHPTYLGDWNETVRKIDTFAGEIGETVSTSSAQIEGLRNSVSHVQSEITSQQGVLEALNGRLTAEELKNTEQDTSISKLNNDTESLDTRVEALENSGLSEQVALNTQNIVTLQGDVVRLNDSVESLENSAHKPIKFGGDINYAAANPNNAIVLTMYLPELSENITEQAVKNYITEKNISMYGICNTMFNAYKEGTGWLPLIFSGVEMEYGGSRKGYTLSNPIADGCIALFNKLLSDWLNNTIPTTNIGYFLLRSNYLTNSYQTKCNFNSVSKTVAYRSGHGCMCIEFAIMVSVDQTSGNNTLDILKARCANYTLD